MVGKEKEITDPSYQTSVKGLHIHKHPNPQPRRGNEKKQRHHLGSCMHDQRPPSRQGAHEHGAEWERGQEDN